MVPHFYGVLLSMNRSRNKLPEMSHYPLGRAWFTTINITPATGQFDKDKELRTPIADISWHSASGYECHTIQDSVHCFGTKKEAEAFAIEAAKAWVDARVKAA